MLPCLFNFYGEYIMKNAGLDETQAGIKIPGRNINNLRYADGTTLKAERSWLKTQHSKKKIMASGSITSWQNKWGNNEAVRDFIFLAPKSLDDDCSVEIKRGLLLRRKAITNLDGVLKSKGITLSTKIHTVKATLFLVVMYGC